VAGEGAAGGARDGESGVGDVVGGWRRWRWSSVPVWKVALRLGVVARAAQKLHVFQHVESAMHKRSDMVYL